MIGYSAGFGTTAGAHRLWAHKTYKAKLPLKIILMIFQTLAVQNDIHEWSRDHRVHHKFTDTDGDPHNINRGFFFSHMGWLLCKKHPDVLRKGKTVDMSDLERDPIVSFQKKLVILYFASYLFHRISIYFYSQILHFARDCDWFSDSNTYPSLLLWRVVEN
jgi:stearoyl-CoA desaturase (delta-9 desaturase)